MMISIITVIVYLSLVFLCSKKIAQELSLEPQKKLLMMQRSLQKLEDHKSTLIIEKDHLDKEALEMFTLYDMTKNITHSLSQQDAFQIFKDNLNKHVRFTSCLLLDPISTEVKNYRKKEDYYVFSLKGKKRRIGYVAIKNLYEEDKEKFMILGHQFALALRRVKLYQEIEKLAITDSLTGLYTRRYTLERFDEELKRSKHQEMNLSFIMIDVDHFKNFNDTYGHIVGDQILREIGLIIKDNIREIDVAGRYGGEELCVILPDTDHEGAIYAAERIRTATENTVIKAYDTTVKATVSIGIAMYPENARHRMELLDKADWALYRAKKNGRNRVCAFGVYEEEQ